MKTLQKFFMLLALFVVPVIFLNVNAQQNFTYTDPIGSLWIKDVAINPSYVVYSGMSDHTGYGNDRTRVNDTVYNNLLISTIPNSVSVIDIVEVVDNILIIAGQVDLVTGAEWKTMIALYNLPNMNLIGYVKFGNLQPGGKAYGVLKENNNIYFSILGIKHDSYYQSTFGGNNNGNLLGTENSGVFKFDIGSNSLSKQLYRPTNHSFMPKSLVKKGNYLYQVRIPSYQQWVLEKYDTELNLISTSSQMYGELDTTIYSRMLVNEEVGIDYVYVYVKDVTDPNNKKGLRKFNTATMTEVPEFAEGTGASVLACTQARTLYSISNNRIVMLSDDGSFDGAMFVYDIASGDIMSYKKFELMQTSGLSYPGVMNQDMYYDNENNVVSVMGGVGGNGVMTFYGTVVPAGGRPMSYDYTPEINPDSDMTMTVNGYPNATITRVGNTFTISGIPESAWGALTINASFINPSSTFEVFSGNGPSWTKDFTDSTEDFFYNVLRYETSSFGYIWETTGFMVRTTNSAGTDEFELEKKLYPNPTDGTVYLPEMYRGYDVEVYDLYGRKLQSSEDASVISLDNVPVGMYLIKIIDPEYRQVGVQKIVKK